MFVRPVVGVLMRDNDGDHVAHSDEKRCERTWVNNEILARAFDDEARVFLLGDLHIASLGR